MKFTWTSRSFDELHVKSCERSWTSVNMPWTSREGLWSSMNNNTHFVKGVWTSHEYPHNTLAVDKVNASESSQSICIPLKNRNIKPQIPINLNPASQNIHGYFTKYSRNLHEPFTGSSQDLHSLHVKMPVNLHVHVNFTDLHMNSCAKKAWTSRKTERTLWRCSWTCQKSREGPWSSLYKSF